METTERSAWEPLGFGRTGEEEAVKEAVKEGSRLIGGGRRGTSPRRGSMIDSG